MGESLDIQNLLQTGYFSTSRARSPREPTPHYGNSAYARPPPPSYDSAKSQNQNYQLVSRRHRFQPPPPSVEDEEESLKREYGSPRRPKSLDEDTPSRGEIEQQPIMLEVHEHNPERRFVILTGPQTTSDEEETERKQDPKPPREEREKRPETSSYENNSSRRYESDSKPKPKPEPRPELRTEPRTDPRADPRIERRPEPRTEPRTERRAEPRVEPRVEPRYERKPESTLKPSSNAGSETDRPRLEKQRSRQDLPKLETDLEDRLPEKYRKPPVNSSRPDNPLPKPPRPNAEATLQPEVIKYSSGGREKAYHGYSQSQGSNRRSPTQRSYPDERRYEESNARASAAPSATKRVLPSVEAEMSARPSSRDRVSDARYRPEYSPQKPSRRERSPEYGKPDREDTSRSSKYPSRDTESRPVDDHPKGPRELHQRQKRSVVVQDGRESAPTLEKVEAPSGPRLRPRAPTIPVPVPTSSGVSEDIPAPPRASSTFPAYNREEQVPPPPPPERPKSQLPYPVDDDRVLDPFDIRKKEWSGRSAYGEEPALAMPDIPFPIAIGPETPLEARSASIPPSLRVPTGPQAPTGSQSWQPPSFDPERDGTRLDRPVGTVRRHSENNGAGGVAGFPECRRKQPVTGKMDWLTIPRSDFNVCPECYASVFANSDFRTSFQPMLRPSDRPIACDFGSCLWYRIAWLLTLKNNKPDLRLFYEVDNAMAATQNAPCPGDRATTRSWLTIWDPYARRAVYDFTVCPRCAKLIQALLPNLSDIFVPLDPRSEPSRNMCSMRFKEGRTRFVKYFDALEITSDLARTEHEEPDVHGLAKELEKMTSVSECFEDKPIANEYWHTMQFLPQFTVCGDCFDEVVRPLLIDKNIIANNFHKKPERLSLATCQLYSPRMREVFQKACRVNDPRYLEDRVIARMEVEADIRDKLNKLDRSNHDEEWVDKQTDKLIQEWKRWE